MRYLLQALQTCKRGEEGRGSGETLKLGIIIVRYRIIVNDLSYLSLVTVISTEKKTMTITIVNDSLNNNYGLLHVSSSLILCPG